MHSIEASQQQWIRKTVTSNVSYNKNSSKCLIENRYNSTDSLNNSTDGTSSGKDVDTNSGQQSVESSAESSNVNQSVGTDLSSSGSDVKTKKKRSTNSWINILNPSYKTRHEEFKRLFRELVPINERLVVDYSCALQKDILVHGRLYVSLNYISFYANIFKWETSLVIKCRDISSLKKANTVGVIPNAIQVTTTSGDRYVFASFSARDKAYVMLFRIWQNALLDQSMSSAQLWQWVHYSYGEDLGLTSEDDEEYNSDNMVHTLSAQASTEPSIEPSTSAQSRTDLTLNTSDSDLSASPEVYEECLDCTVVPSDCRCGTHVGKLILNVTFPVAVDRVFELIFTDNKFIQNLHKSRRTYDLCVTQWDDSTKDRVRQLTYTVNVNNAFAKSVRTVEKQELLEESTAGAYYSIRSDADSMGAPYADTFTLRSVWCLTQDSAHVTRVRVHAQVVYKKTVWGLALMRPMIEKAAFQGTTDFCNQLATQLSHLVLIERDLGLISDTNVFKINPNVIEVNYNSDDSFDTSTTGAIAPNVVYVPKPGPDSKLIEYISKIVLVNNQLLLRIIFIALLLSFIFNFIILFQISTIESNNKNNNYSFSASAPIDMRQMAKNRIF